MHVQGKELQAYSTSGMLSVLVRVHCHATLHMTLFVELYSSSCYFIKVTIDMPAS